ncbi:MAG: RES domain-containing protein [Alphaproteobacteria bacterium]|nr:MAG: RES domain-containing protein [Alphaproteobacteria bacterium]
MSSRTWTPGALSAEQRPLSGICWRVIEAQHRVSTLKLVDTLDEQSLLESLIEETKPPVPPECRHLHYLLSTPFRYASIYPRGSRFRRAGMTLGVYYASASAATAVAEMTFHRLLFFAESPATPWPVNAGEFTAFSVPYATALGIDLTKPPLSRDEAIWTNVTAYEGCQALAEAARAAAITVIAYRSVRDPGRGTSMALLSCTAFARDEPTERETWRIQFGVSGARAVCEFSDARLEFGRAAFAADPRIARLNWERG